MISISTIAERTRADLLGFAQEIRRSLVPKSDSDIRLVDEQLAMARSASWANSLIVPIASVLIAISQSANVATVWLIGWPLAMIVTCGASELYYRHLLLHADHSAADVSRRARAHARLTLLQSALWCSMGYAMWQPGNPEAQGFLVLIIACSLSGWTSMGAFHLATAAAGMPTYLVALLAMPIAMGSDNVYILSALSGAFFLLMRTLMMANYRTREKMILLEHERSGLIDKLKTAKDDSDHARQRAETASRAKSDFLANMSHELRTPLNAILGFSEIIHTKAMGSTAIEQYSEYGGYIHSSGGHLLSLINDILDLAKIEAGRLTLREAEVDLRVLMDDIMRMLESRASSGGIELAVEVDYDFPNLMADERAMRQMVVNLASNAIKFTQPGGRVTAFANVLGDGRLSFGIDDTGIGIAPEEHSTVFESFGQGRHDAVLADKGTGLGLPIVKGLAEAHGGSILLNSVPNEGTRVTVIMPAARARVRLRAAS
ncbi:MAG: sensor histidine kinase [Proteobacteria bacterium]|nr:sensor histidine kinase [Pseudomonadota bacterium]